MCSENGEIVELKWFVSFFSEFIWFLKAGNIFFEEEDLFILRSKKE